MNKLAALHFLKVAIATCTLLFISACVFAQKKRPVKIVLIGTMHLTPSQTDVYKNKAIDLSSKQRQTEINGVVNKIAAFAPDQICLEYPREYQYKMDSIYKAYKQGLYTLKDNERDLFGIKAAKKLNLPRLTCINYSYGKFDYDTLLNFAKQNRQQAVMDSADIMARGFLKVADEKLATLTLSNFLVFINSEEELKRNLSFYTKYALGIGNEKNHVGANLVADWYSTNIHIYNNIIQLTRPTDKAIVVIFGQGHIPILKHLFENNPDFEVVEVKEVFN